MERHNTDSFEDEEPRKNFKDSDELLCGYGSCTPRYLQCFHSAKWLLFFLGLCAFIQSFVVNAIFPVGLSTLERQFKMSSTHTGIISSWYDFAVLLIVFPVCHFGNSGHKGRWIGIGGLVMAAGSFICALPHYMIAPYEPEALGVNKSIDFGQCFPGRSTPEKHCNESSWASFLNPYFWMFILGQTLHGLGSTPLFSIGTAFIDENVSQKASPMYLAIHAVVTSLGPVIGLFSGGFLLRIYTDFDRVDKIPLRDDSDPRWLGAWWLGFLGSGISALLVAFPILGYARELPDAKRMRAKDVNQVHAVNAEKQKDDKEHKLMDTCIGILRNPTFIVVIVLGVFESIIINGFAAFMPKILETLLSTSPMIGAYLSSVVIFAAAFGVLVGGAVIRKLNLQVGGMLKMTLVCHVIALIFTFGFTLTCPQRHFVGITYGYDNSIFHYDHVDRLTAQCNADCQCTAKEWNPVCHKETKNMYYSPCLAGCKTQINRKTTDPSKVLIKQLHQHPNGEYAPVQNDIDAEREYDVRSVERKSTDYVINAETIWTDCACLQGNVTNFTHKDLVSGYCSESCGWKVYVFICALFVTVVASFASGIPTQQIMLRVVPFDQRTIAIGIHWTFLRLLGFIPGGILFGILIDNSCIKWGQSECGGKTSCLVYDPIKLSWTIMAVAIVCKLVSILGTILGYMTYRPNDIDNGTSIQTTDSRGPLSLVVNDDRPLEEMGAPVIFVE